MFLNHMKPVKLPKTVIYADNTLFIAGFGLFMGLVSIKTNIEYQLMV